MNNRICIQSLENTETFNEKNQTLLFIFDAIEELVPPSYTRGRNSLRAKLKTVFTRSGLTDEDGTIHDFPVESLFPSVLNHRPPTAMEFSYLTILVCPPSQLKPLGWKTSWNIAVRKKLNPSRIVIEFSGRVGNTFGRCLPTIIVEWGMSCHHHYASFQSSPNFPPTVVNYSRPPPSTPPWCEMSGQWAHFRYFSHLFQNVEKLSETRIMDWWILFVTKYELSNLLIQWWFFIWGGRGSGVVVGQGQLLL